jgi:hypothetical protein
MGVHILMRIEGFKIPVDKTADCLKAFNGLNNGPYQDIEEAFAAFEYEAVKQDDGSVVIIGFTGKELGDYWIIHRIICPFIKHGIITCHTDFDVHWKWEFIDGEIKYRRGKITYED